MQTFHTHTPTAARALLGLVFTVFGLNGFFGFLPMPSEPPAAGAFLGALVTTGYLFPLLKGTEVITGLLLLGNRFVPLALTVLAPVIINIVAFHAFLAPGGLPVALVLLVLEVFLAWSYRDSFASVLKVRARARTSKTAERGHAPITESRVSPG